LILEVEEEEEDSDSELIKSTKGISSHIQELEIDLGNIIENNDSLKSSNMSFSSNNDRFKEEIKMETYK